MLYVTIVMNAMAFPVQQFIPAIGRDHLGVGATLVGLLVAADGFGQLAGAGLMSMTNGVRYHGRVFVAGSVAVMVLTILFVWSPWYALAFALLAVGGLGQSGFSTMQSAITMLAAPQGMRGRMMGLLSFCIGVGTPLGGLEMGALAAAFTIQIAISANILVGLVLIIPVLALTPLVSRPLIQPAPATAET
jgi:MFS family permease